MQGSNKGNTFNVDEVLIELPDYSELAHHLCQQTLDLPFGRDEARAMIFSIRFSQETSNGRFISAKERRKVTSLAAL